MSHANIELVMRALEAGAKRPRPDFETINALYHPDHVFVPVTSRLGDESEVKGARGYKAWLEEIEGLMPWEMSPEGAVDIGAGTVLAVATMRWRGASSEVEVEQRMWMLLTVADGRITRTEGYLDPAEALEAARALEPGDPR